ncbi:hypothetical protein [Phycicoccus sonneratiae]|uniref:DUF2442 domain-containing protein n=1 Tax=Phycicoccus sonneratiae TaxID=2807628 RepID=A0ABS2CK92_9MICO|nr:hypothetical protein [Phycicoccus sonneraticus]MBM6399504.1 hypothetical protein [Phycicoccus sonneraticus]
MEEIAVRAETQEAERDVIVVVTLEGRSWLMNVRATPAEWQRLSEVPAADWRRRRAVRLGTVAGVDVWWHVSDDTLYMTLGEDGPESADVGLVLPVGVLRRILDEVAAARDESP